MLVTTGWAQSSKGAKRNWWNILTLNDYKFRLSAFVFLHTWSLQKPSRVSVACQSLEVITTPINKDSWGMCPRLPNRKCQVTYQGCPPSLNPSLHKIQASRRTRINVFTCVILCYEHNNVKEAPPIAQMWWENKLVERDNAMWGKTGYKKYFPCQKREGGAGNGSHQDRMCCHLATYQTIVIRHYDWSSTPASAAPTGHSSSQVSADVAIRRALVMEPSKNKWSMTSDGNNVTCSSHSRLLGHPTSSVRTGQNNKFREIRSLHSGNGFLLEETVIFRSSQHKLRSPYSLLNTSHSRIPRPKVIKHFRMKKFTRKNGKLQDSVPEFLYKNISFESWCSKLWTYRPNGKTGTEHHSVDKHSCQADLPTHKFIYRKTKKQCRDSDLRFSFGYLISDLRKQGRGTAGPTNTNLYSKFRSAAHLLSTPIYS
jgi:hypothetical protein